MEKILNRFNDGKNYIYFSALFVFFLVLSYNTPLTGDDWTWGTEIGWNRFERFFYDYNGRYLSNIFELIMVRIDLLRYVILALLSSLLVYMIGKITDHHNNPMSLAIAFILIMLMPIRIFAQTMGWSAGFINYVPSVMLLLAYLYVVRNIFDEQKPSYHQKLWIFMIPLGIATQLIVEHVTLFAVVTAISVIGYTYFKHKTLYTVHFAYLISVCIGAVIMFTNTAYLKVLTGEDAYRTLENDVTANMGLFEKIYFMYSGNMYKFLFIENSLINLIIGFLVLILILRFKTTSRWISFLLKPVLVLIITSAMVFLLVFREILRANYLGEFTNDFEAILCALFFASIVVAVALFVRDKVFKARLLYYLFAIVFLIAPFIFITPFGPRCVFASYIFMVLVTLELIAYLMKETSLSFKPFAKPLIALTMSVVVFYLFVFIMNGSASRDRLAHLQEKVEQNEQTITLKELPFSQFLWMPSPKPDMYHTKTFKMFYDVPKETELKIVPYRE